MMFLPDLEASDAQANDETIPEADDYTPEAYDEYLTAEVLLPNMGTVTKTERKRDAESNPVGKRNANPKLDTREYEVEFPDGATDVFTTNTIAENLYSQVDEEGNSYSIMSEIVDHKKDTTVLTKDDGLEYPKDGLRRAKSTTKGWKLLVAWKDGTPSWVPLKDSKESHPVQVAEYALANKTVEEPAFACWCTTTVRK